MIVDEYQDLNSCDLEVIKLIAARGCSVIAAGDDDQSIYSFRKAGERRTFGGHSAAALALQAFTYMSAVLRGSTSVRVPYAPHSRTSHGANPLC
jgi:hypothetical protein